MQPSLNYIFHMISREVPDARLCDYNAWRFDFDWVSVAATDTTAKSGFLYFVEPGGRILPGEGNAQYACVVLETTSADFAGVPRVVLPAESDMMHVFDYTVDVVDRFRRWGKSVNEILLQDASLQDLLEATFSLVPRPMYIADIYWRMVARVDGDMNEMSSYWLHEIRHGCLPLQTIERLSESGEYRRVTEAKRALLVHTESFNLDYVAKAINFRGKPIALLFIINTWNDLGPCEIEIAEKLGDLLGPVLGMRKNDALIDSFQQMGLVSLLDNAAMSDEQLESALTAETGWGFIGDFTLAAIRIPRSELGNPMARMRIESLMGSGFDSCMIPDGPLTFAVFRNAEGMAGDVTSHLRDCANTLDCRLLVSARFSRFSDARFYYELFKNRLENAGPAETKQQGALELYDEMIPALLAQSCADRFPRTYEVDLLEEYDATHGTEFVRTLYLYLAHERNTVATAAALYLHRNSTHARLEKIRDLIDANLDNPNVRLKLLVDLNARINSGVTQGQSLRLPFAKPSA